MTDLAEQPASIEGFQRILKTAKSDSRTITVAGACSKLRISDSNHRIAVSTSRYCGIVDHQASDFTITVRTGTPVREVMAVLDEAGQFLPFDPVFAGRGATVGGMIAAGMNGACRLRHGGLRDFVIGCQFLDGLGNTIRAGGRVVKNAAGFDLPKFLVGSAGKFGLLLEATFKVFPKPRRYRTFLTDALPTETAILVLKQLLESGICFDALEILESNRIAVRWSGDDDVEFQSVCDYAVQSPGLNFEILQETGEQQFWNDLSDFSAIEPETRIVKIPVVRSQICELDHQLAPLNIDRRFSAAGNVAILFLPNGNSIGPVDNVLFTKGLSGHLVVGKPEQFLIGSRHPFRFLNRIKSALDPACTFGPIESDAGNGVAR